MLPAVLAPAAGSLATVGLPPLDNPAPDARGLAALLARHGFEVIACDGPQDPGPGPGSAPGCLDLDRARFLKALDELAQRAAGADLALIYFLITAGGVAGGEAKLDAALDADEKAIAEAERVAAERRQAAARSARDLATSHSKVTGVLFAQGDTRDAIARWRETLGIAEARAAIAEAAETRGAGKPGVDTAEALGEVAWRALFAREVEKGLAAAERAHALAPELVWIDTNRAHALMFLERTREASALYLVHKGKMPRNKPWERAIAEDFGELRKAGLAHPLMAEIEKALGTAAAPATRR